MNLFGQSKSPNLIANKPSGIYFGGLSLPWEAATSHFLICGSTGSGKTLTLRMMMGSVLPQILTSPDQRAVILDVKQDALSILEGILGPAGRDRVRNLNPFDSRCYAWDIAADVTEPEIALQFATILIPEEQSQNRYFSDAARDLLAGAIQVLIQKAPGRWTLADLLYVMRSPLRLISLLAQTEEGRDLIALHLEGGYTTRSVVSMLRSKLAPFEVPAALWSHASRAGRTISLQQFLRENLVLVLGNYQAATAPIQALNRVVFARLTEMILDQSESETRRTYFFLDEVRKLKRLEGLDDLMTNGRSKGASVTIGFQDLDGMKAEYTEFLAGEITSMPASIGILRVSGASTPQWASSLFGEQEVVQKTRSRSSSYGQSGQSSTAGDNETIRERKLYLPSCFRLIPRPQRGSALCGYFSSAFAGNGQPYYAEIPAREVDAMLPPKGRVVNFQPWPAGTDKRLPVWTQTDYARLGLPAPLEAPPSGGSDPAGGNGIFDPFGDEENHPRFRPDID